MGSQARHGTRAPTKKKMKELDALSTRLEVILGNVKEQKSVVFPAWLKGWKSPWTGKHKGGELISEGESELYELGVRVREKYPQLFRDDYHPDIYPIKATQVTMVSMIHSFLFILMPSKKPPTYTALCLLHETKIAGKSYKCWLISVLSVMFVKSSSYD